MTWLNTASLRWLIRATAVCTVLATVAVGAARLAAQDDRKPWPAPDAARQVKNPFPANPENLAAGEQTFKANCVICHGDKGKGDGIAGKGLKPTPANFTDSKMLAMETDGSLYWKMSEGRDPMPTWKDILSEKERWQLVDYIRKLNKDANAK